MAEANLPTPEELRKLLAYDPETGVLTWKPRPSEMFSTLARKHIWNARFAGKQAGSAGPFGYAQIKILGKPYRAHRVAWAVLTGEWPCGHIDHKNGRRSDNRIENLRIVTRSENCRNQKRSSRNTSGVTGVSVDKRSGKFKAQIYIGDKYLHLGYFADFDAAVAARKAADLEFGYSHNHGRDA